MTRPIEPGDLASLLALNNDHATELSFLEVDLFRRMVGAAFRACCTDAADAFILAFDERAAYDSPNFLWFRRHRSRFVYVDRVVVSPARRRQGVADGFYDEVERDALASGRDFIGCEVNRVPANPASDAFHARRGFYELATASSADGAKTVRYLGRALKG